MQNGLRKRAVEIIKVSAEGRFAEAGRLVELYLKEIQREQKNADEAIESVKQILS